MTRGSFTVSKIVADTEGGSKTHAATKFVLSSFSSTEVRSRVPPTICLTTPWCKSMQGRNWLCRLEGPAVAEADDMFVPPKRRWREEELYTSFLALAVQVSGGDAQAPPCVLVLSFARDLVLSF